MPVHVRTDSDLSSCVRIAEEVHRLDGYPVYLPTDLRQFLASPRCPLGLGSLRNAAIFSVTSRFTSAAPIPSLRWPARPFITQQDQFGVIDYGYWSPPRTASERASGGCSSRRPPRIHYVVAFGRSSMW